MEKTTTKAEMAQSQWTVFDDTDRKLIRRIKRITSCGNDAEIRRKKDGSLAVYEVKKRFVEY